MEQTRRPFQGVLNILSFNRHFYVWGIAVLAVLSLSWYWIDWPQTLFWIVITGFLYGLIMPLIVSAYVYDFSGYYKFRWLNNPITSDEKVNIAININAGFDETSFIINDRFPGADLKVFDFYDPRHHTEVAIKRARKVSLVYPGMQQIASDKLPLADHSADIIFLLSAVHEIRSHEEKVSFFRECYRVCRPGGKLIVVEHLRDIPNFLAFTIGFTHFFSRNTWKDAMTKAGFNSIHETKFTPFMSIFHSKTA